MSVRGWRGGAAVVALAISTGACGGTSPDDVAATSEVTSTPTAATPTSAPATPTGTASATPTPTATSPVLSGTRQATVTRVDGFEAGLSLTDEGRLAEVDDDSGRQLFVPVPLGGQDFLVMSYRGRGGGSGPGEPVCWQVRNPGDSQPLHVRGADCDEDEARQRFTIAPAEGAAETFLISNNSAFLRHSRDSGLILEELGDAAPTDSFRLNDNGPAPDRG
ncbi:hypothetical protein [Micromonospora radicis]|uniref:Uncharacterized protein n=1 Tax=Micromonospora radicis TaxID=1894971 RepID=A0A418MWA8_9ACTN|nr:hypothetical protein [Micromonospora radicis]RIV39161.1 hypothetical protein D2L64_09885 [Micromonospora radicis]